MFQPAPPGSDSSKPGPARVCALRIERMWRALSAVPRAHSYPMVGVALAFFAPTGLLVARAAAAGHSLDLGWALADIDQLPSTYSYVAASTVAVFAVLGWVLGRSFDRVRFLSITDPLTGAFNGRHFAQCISQELIRGRRHGHATCVLCVDIDRLKAINDGSGHQAGDRAILAVCRILVGNVRAVDAVARVGGDEFAVLLPETTARQASALSRRILTEVGRHSDGASGKLAVSIGITELAAKAESDPEEMLAVADAALYRAKAAGGGHVALGLIRPAAPHSQHAALMEGARLVESENRAGSRSMR